MKSTLKSAVGTNDTNEEFVLFCDNLSPHTSQELQKAVRSLNGIVWYGVANSMNISHPVDSGFGQMLKTTLKRKQNEWLQLDENIDLWLGNIPEKKLDIKQGRILITHWVGDAWKIF